MGKEGGNRREFSTQCPSRSRNGRCANKRGIHLASRIVRRVVATAFVMVSFDTLTSTWSDGTTIVRTRAFPHWYTRRGSHNREVTRVKKDVRVNLARCISGDELIPPISLRPGLFPVPVSFSSSRISLSLAHSFCLPCFLRFPLAKYVTIFATRFLPRTSYTVVLLSGPWLQHAGFSPPTDEFLFIYGGLNEP